jgi:hypothetical protein
MLERELSEAAGKIISEFLLRPVLRTLSEDAADSAIAEERLTEIDAHPERVLRGPALEERMRRWES